MNVKASLRSALIVAAGFWVCLAGPLQAAEDGAVAASTSESAAGPPVALNKFTRKARHRKHVSSHRKSVKIASKASRANARTAQRNKAAVPAIKDDDQQVAIPASVANAHAQLAADDLPADMNTVSTKASDMLQTMAARQLASADQEVPAAGAAAELVSADQLNDVDRALSEAKSDAKSEAKSEAKSDDRDKAPAVTPAMAVAQAPAQTQAAASPDDSAWGQTSLIGKIFIAFGALLTLASAARLFMA